MSETYTGVPDAPESMLSPAGEYVRAPKPEIGGEAGAGLESGGQALLRAVDIYGKIRANNVTNQWMDQVHKVYYGDPQAGAATNPDGTALMTSNGGRINDGGLFAKHGDD